MSCRLGVGQPSTVERTPDHDRLKIIKLRAGCFNARLELTSCLIWEIPWRYPFVHSTVRIHQVNHEVRCCCNQPSRSGGVGTLPTGNGPGRGKISYFLPGQVKLNHRHWERDSGWEGQKNVYFWCGLNQEPTTSIQIPRWKTDVPRCVVSQFFFKRGFIFNKW